MYYTIAERPQTTKALQCEGLQCQGLAKGATVVGPPIRETGTHSLAGLQHGEPQREGLQRGGYSGRATDLGGGHPLVCLETL